MDPRRSGAVGRVVFGRGLASAQLPGMLRDGSIERVLVITSRTLFDSSEVVSRVLDAVGSVARSEIFFAQAHSPLRAVQSAADHAFDLRAGALVVIGGSSASDLAKGAALLMSEGVDRADLIARLQDGSVPREMLDAAKPPIFNVPTTLSGAEFSGNAGLTNDRDIKRVFRSPTLFSRAVILDADCTVATPPWLWASTGLKLIDHAVERTLATDHNPEVDAQSAAGLRIANTHLAASVPIGGTDLAQRREPLLTALRLIQSNVGTVGMGYSHALAREVGGRNGVPHGIGSALFLPAVLRWCGDASASSFLQLAYAFGVVATERDAAALVIERVDALVDELGLPRRLRDAAIPQTDLRAIAERTMADPTVRTSPWQPRDAHQLESLLAEIW